MASQKPRNTDEYIAGFPKDVQKILQEVRQTIKDIVPEAEEVISYGIPTFNLNKSYLIYFAGFKSHIGIYPAPVNEESFRKDFAKYKTGRGSVQFPLDQPMPLALIRKITKYRIKKTLEKSGNKGKTPIKKK